MKKKSSDRLGYFTKSPIFRVVTAQVFATFLASASWLIFGRVAAISALMAGITCVLPGCYTLVVSLRPVIKGDPGLRQALRGELGKFALTVSLFALVFVFVKPLNVLVFFSTFIGLQLCMAATLWLGSRRLLKR
jgi:ATP synthase protein I|tara:strand:+ start:51 stop:452 length:402 start_codon:yes stop_codon:yes gene_type:complete